MFPYPSQSENRWKWYTKVSLTTVAQYYKYEMFMDSTDTAKYTFTIEMNSQQILYECTADKKNVEKIAKFERANHELQRWNMKMMIYDYANTL